MNAKLEPKLAPPGAGLPKYELFIGRMLFAFRQLTGNRDSFNAAFQQERAKIAGMVRSCDAKSASTRVLIARPRGLEDSSRYWSIWMTLDHLRIVNQSISQVIGKLGSGVKPEGRASTAAVKPNPDVTGEVVAAYELACDNLLAAVAAVENLKTQERYAHPWFGPLDAAGWHAMSAGHMRMHRVQMERILAGLANT